MSWENVKLGDVCTKIGSGATPKGGSTVYVDSGTSFIRSQNVYNLKFDYSGLVWINEEAAKKLNGVTIQKNDVLLNITGDSVARTCVVPDEVLPARVNQHVAIVRPDSSILNPYFLNYYLASPYMQSFMLGLAVGKGASRNAMTKDMISGYEVPCPPLDVQLKIVDILKTYDSLIENNQKQIKLLEEAAQRLYKEWFVDLRFPGYEDAEIVDGVPKGWQKLPMSSVGEYMNGFAFKPTDWQETGLPIIKIKEMGNGIGDDTPRNNGERVPQKYLVKAGDILFSWSATLMAIIWDGEDGWLNQHLFKVSPVEGIGREYLLQSLQCTIEEFKNLTTGSTMKHIQRGKLDQVYVNVPDKNIMQKYGDMSENYREQVIALSRKNILLAEARDRLLPKLINGEIEV